MAIPAGVVGQVTRQVRLVRLLAIARPVAGDALAPAVEAAAVPVECALVTFAPSLGGR